MNYLGRPVFQFQLNWGGSVVKQFSYDLREVSLGFGAEFFTSLQQSVVQGWRFDVELTDGAQIQTFDAFTAALYGRLVGFWLPAPMEGMKIVSATSATVFYIKTQGLADTWQDHPDIYLYITREGYAPAAAKITEVVSIGAAERVTLDEAIEPDLLDAASSVSRLHYVRLANDEEAGEFPAQNWQTRQVKVVELPTEYAAIETGIQPIYLYHFWANFPVGAHWRYASFAADVVSQNLLYTKFNLNHGSISQNINGDAEKLSIDAQKDANHPFSLYLPLPFPRPLNVEVFAVQYGDLDTQKRVFTGKVTVVDDEGDKLTATCDSFASVLNKKTPRHLIGPDCGNTLYDTQTCRVSRFQYETTGVITTLNAFTGVSSPTIVLTLAAPTASRKLQNYFAQGFLESGVGLNYELRVVISSQWFEFNQTLVLTLNAPLKHAQVGDQIQLIPGCDGKAATCISKFNNYDNFSGWQFVPVQNPTIASVQNDVAAGGKK